MNDKEATQPDEKEQNGGGEGSTTSKSRQSKMKIKGKKSTEKAITNRNNISKKITTESEEKSEDENDDKQLEEKKNIKNVPLLDQPLVIEGSRTRKGVLPKCGDLKTSKFSMVEIPNGKGTPLGKISCINSRLKKLDGSYVRKELHRIIFGKVGDPSNIERNLLKFNGFPFEKESDNYFKMRKQLNKLSYDEIKQILYFLDLEASVKKKEDSVTKLIDFLVTPSEAGTAKSTVVERKKRNATKRNYKDMDGDEQEVKKRRKTSPSKEKKVTKEEESKEKEVDKKKSSKKTSQEAPGSSVENEKGTKSVDISDEELKKFLRRVLADANLDKTTLKTIYGLISKEYPGYDFSQKKPFIKEIVKSLIQDEK